MQGYSVVLYEDGSPDGRSEPDYYPTLLLALAAACTAASECGYGSGNEFRVYSPDGRLCETFRGGENG